MRKILLLTPLYPIPYPENNATPVCHFFAREWVKLGYEVQVIHVQPVHCRAWHLLIRLFGKQISNWAGGGNFYAKRLETTESYLMDGVPVHRIPTYNFIPHGRYPHKSISKLIGEIKDILCRERFDPDMIVGHMLEMEIIPELNLTFGAKSCMVMHGIPKKMRLRYPEFDQLMASYDLWGFRSKAIKEQFESEFGAVKDSFICYSGIPGEFLDNAPDRSFPNKVRNFIFVGELIERKCPAALISAIPAAEDDFNLTFVGDGPERAHLDRLVEDGGIGDKVVFTGKIPRNDIRRHLDEADCFIMISRGEAFGLVYLEAMARGCIVIASRGEGIDGVISDGMNGFLCNAGDENELAGIIRRINAMPSDELMELSRHARESARRMTDSAVAEDYIDKLKSIC